MSARVLNPAMMSEMGHRGIGGVGSSRVAPSRAALERVRRDLFGPVDHAAARALAERELRAQSLLDAERWGFDFHLEKPKANSRFEWKEISTRDIVPEPYALRGMPYLSKNSPSIARKTDYSADNGTVKSWTRKRVAIATAAAAAVASANAKSVTISPINNANVARKTETTPPQESRLPRINDNSNNVDEELSGGESFTKKNHNFENQTPTTPPVNTSVTTRKQSSITDFMKSRKRTLNVTTKSIVDLPEKMPRNASRQIPS